MTLYLNTSDNHFIPNQKEKVKEKDGDREIRFSVDDKHKSWITNKVGRKLVAGLEEVANLIFSILIFL